MRAIDADALKKDLTRFYDNEVTAKRLIDEQPTIEPDTDTVSRQEVISTINVLRTRCDTDDIDDYHDLMVKAIENLPPFYGANMRMNQQAEVTDTATISRQQATDALKEALNPSKGKVRPYDSLWDMYLDEFEDDCGERV